MARRPRRHRAGRAEYLTLGEYLDRNGYTDAFHRGSSAADGRGHLVDHSHADAGLSAASPSVRFFIHHGLLDLVDRPKWRTVSGGGSKRYVNRMVGRCAAIFAVALAQPRSAANMAASPSSIRRGDRSWFSEVVIATHADQALRLLADADELEDSMLGTFNYTDNVGRAPPRHLADAQAQAGVVELEPHRREQRRRRTAALRHLLR